MIRKNITKSQQKWPISAEELIESLDSSGPFTNIYNVIAWSLHPDRTLNEHGYVSTPSKNEANKLWAISSDWESLITKERSAKGAALSLTVHRLTGSKETSNFLHRCGHGISYADIQLLNTDWANRVTRSSSHKLPSGFRKGKAVHISIDNSDGKQQTLTGAHTTHYTNGTVFQLDKDGPGKDVSETPMETDDVSRISEEEAGVEEEYGTYKIKKKVSPPAVAYEDKTDNDLLKWCLNRDLA